MAQAEGEDHGRFLRSAGSVSLAVSLSRVTGVVREMILARWFGASAVYDAFLLGFRIPNLMRDLFAEGALSSAFVPTFTQYLSQKGRAAAVELSRLVATAILLIVGGITLLGIAFSPALVRALAPGFAAVPGKFELAVLLTRVMFPFLVLVALAAQAMGVLNACNRFGIPALASAWFNVGSVVVGVALGYSLGRTFQQGPIVSMACGVVAGGALQLLWQVPALRREGFSWRARFDWNHPGLRQIGRLMLPAILGNAAVQINVLVTTNLASSLRGADGLVMDGPVSWLGYAFRFFQLPLGVFGVAIASATLPSISRSAAAGRMDEFRATLTRSLDMIMLLTIPAAVGLAILGRSMIAAIYQGGRFSAHDTEQTAAALACYAVGLTGYAAIKVLAPAFYALGSARVPMLVSAASIVVNLVTAVALTRWAGWGHAGLAMATSAVALASALALFAALAARLHGAGGARLASAGLRILAASALMGAVCWASSGAVRGLLGPGRLGALADVALSIPLGAVVFYGAAHLLRVPGVETMRATCYTAFSNAPRLEVGDPPAGA